MSAVLEVAAERVGAANCLCPPDIAASGSSGPPQTRVVLLFGAGAAASVLSQALTFSLLPLVGTMLAPSRWLAALPLVAVFVGAIVATFPASILTDAFGRRAAFALGASLGVAGGLVVACGLMLSAFWLVAVGAFWLGIANGFALRYRHAAAAGTNAEATRAVALVLGAGALIGLIAPTLAGLAESKLTPFLGVGSALVAAAAHVFALGAAIALPSGSAVPVRVSQDPGERRWLLPTLTAAVAWFGMMAVMAFAPLGLAGCGFGFSTTVGAVAWHLVAMYAPALALGLLLRRFGPGTISIAGLVLIGLAAVAAGMTPRGASVLLALVTAGAGWSLATSAALVALHRGGPSRLAVAAHDASILIAGAGGALLSGQFFGT